MWPQVQSKVQNFFHCVVIILKFFELYSPEFCSEQPFLFHFLFLDVMGLSLLLIQNLH